MAKKNAQDLKCGDVFDFRGSTYGVLSSFTDSRHTQTIITALELGDATKAIGKVKEVIVFRLFRTFKVDVTGRKEITLNLV